MKKILCTLTLILAFGAVPTHGQGMLPAQFSRWTSSGPSVRIEAAAVEQLSGSDAAILREDGLLTAERRNYERGSRSLSATLHRMRDASGAYAAFTAFRTEEMTGSGMAPFFAVGRSRALAVIGERLLEITGTEEPSARCCAIVSVLGPSGISVSEFKDLADSLRPTADKTPYPPVSSYLPVSGLTPNSEKYVLGTTGLRAALAARAFDFLPQDDWLGFGTGAEATFAKYRIGGRDFCVLLAEYPTPQVAGKRLKRIEEQFTSVGGAPPRLIVRKKSSLLSMVLNPASEADANALLDRVRLETHVTWNEPTHSLREPSFNVMIVEAFVGTGVILIFAVIAGIGFGGLRLLTKYFLPGKVFDRGERLEILQLGISSKPIEAKDFY